MASGLYVNEQVPASQSLPPRKEQSSSTAGSYRCNISMEFREGESGNCDVSEKGRHWSFLESHLHAFNPRSLHSNQSTSSISRNSPMKQNESMDLSFPGAAHCGQIQVVRMHPARENPCSNSRSSWLPAPGTTGVKVPVACSNCSTV